MKQFIFSSSFLEEEEDATVFSWDGGTGGVKEPIKGVSQCSLESTPQHLVTVWPWLSNVISLCLPSVFILSKEVSICSSDPILLKSCRHHFLSSYGISDSRQGPEEVGETRAQIPVQCGYLLPVCWSLSLQAGLQSIASKSPTVPRQSAMLNLETFATQGTEWHIGNYRSEGCFLLCTPITFMHHGPDASGFGRWLPAELPPVSLPRILQEGHQDFNVLTFHLCPICLSADEIWWKRGISTTHEYTHKHPPLTHTLPVAKLKRRKQKGWSISTVSTALTMHAAGLGSNPGTP